MEPFKLKRLITHYHKGKTSPAECYIVEQWLESFQDDEPDITIGDTNFLISFQQGVVDRAFANKKSLQIHRNRLRAFAAAALLLCVASVSLTFYIKQSDRMQNTVVHKIYTDSKEMKRLILPDSTVVYLNINSSLEIANRFGKLKREVSLKGEAYFEVTHDALKPFKIQADGLDIRVIGTSFNVNTQHSLGDISVDVNSGVVEISDRVKLLAVLYAEDGLTYDRKGMAFKLLRIPAGKSNWWKGVNVLTNASFSKLAEVLYNLYGVTLHSNDPALRKLSYTLTVRSTSTLKQTLDQISAMLNKKHRKEGDKIIIY